MQSQPLVDIEVHHHRLTYHSGLHSLTRFRSAVRNVAQTLHLSSGNHHHRQPVEAGASTTSSEPNSPRLQQQPNRLKKGFSGPRSLLKRFRSVAKTMSAEDDDGSGAGATPPKGAITEPDTVAATSDNWNSTCELQQQQDHHPLELANGLLDEKETNATGSGAPTDITAAPEPQGTDGPAKNNGVDESQQQPDPAAAQPSPSTDLDSDGVKVYKKVSTNGKLILYLINRDLVITKDYVSPLHAVVTVEPEELQNRKIFAQILLTFRYGRDDEEVMGLKLSNESVLCVEQVYPILPTAPQPQPLTKCQEVLMKRLGPHAHLINMKLTHAVPASVRLLPAKEYRGAAIGINYDLRVYTAESIEEKPQRRCQVRMAIRLVQYAPLDIQQTAPPQLRLEKHFLLREGTIQIEAGLDRTWYTQGAPICVCLRINNRSSRIVKKIQIRAIQHVDVTMFSNGKFKNTIAAFEESEKLPVAAGQTHESRIPLSLMENGGGRHWVALEDRYGRLTATLASTTLKSAPNERHFFAIYISYYVKVRLVVSGVGGDVSIKIPFILMRDGPECNANELDEPYQETRRNSAKPITAPPEEQPASVQGTNQPEEISAELHPEPLDPISSCLPNDNQEEQEGVGENKPAIPSEIVEPCADTVVASVVPIEDGNRAVSPCSVNT